MIANDFRICVLVDYNTHPVLIYLLYTDAHISQGGGRS